MFTLCIVILAVGFLLDHFQDSDTNHDTPYVPPEVHSSYDMFSDGVTSRYTSGK